MRTTEHTFFVPMTPGALPEQWLDAVVRMPEKLVNLNKFIQWVNGIDPKKNPKGMPRRLTFL